MFADKLVSNDDFMIDPQQKSQIPIPEWSKNAVIYEVNLRQYTNTGTFKDFLPEIERLKKLGVDILWFMPIYPIGAKNRKGTLGSCYSIRDYQAVNPDHGSLNDFKEIVKQVHAAGMYVLLDWVANHSSWDNKLIFQHPGWYTWDSIGNVSVPTGTDWSDVADFNYEERDLWEYMITSMKFWLTETGIDGFRCDVAGMVPSEFWQAVYPALKETKPEIFMLAEWDDPALHEVAFHMSYAWDIHKSFNAIAKGEGHVAQLVAMLGSERERYLPEAFRMHFTSNHDENSWNGSEFERLGPAYECFAALTYILPGMPLIYSGQEAGNNKRLSFFDKDTIAWKPDPMTDVYTALNYLIHSNPAIWNGAWGGSSELIECTDIEVFILVRTKQAHRVIGLFNLQNKSTEFALPPEIQTATYTDLHGTTIEVHDNKIMTMEPWEYLILSSSKIQ